MTRQEKWLEQGYTKEQIENHLSGERYKAKQTNDRRKRNNEKNKEIITQIKNDLFKEPIITPRGEVTVLSINPTVDGLGFWIKFNIKFNDGSQGNFREFNYFEDFSKDEFIKNLL